MIVIVEEGSEDRAAISAVSRAAFGADYEAKLIEDLRRDGVVVASLAAVENGRWSGTSSPLFAVVALLLYRSAASKGPPAESGSWPCF